MIDCINPINENLFCNNNFLKRLKARKAKDHTKQLSKGPNKIFKKNVAKDF